MRRFFAKNLFFVIGINLLVKPLWVFLIDRTVQNRVGPGPYGTYAALLNFAVIFQIIIDFGLNSYNTRTISQDPDQFATQFPILLTARLLLMSVYAGVVMLLGYLLHYRGDALLLLGGVVVLQSLTILLLFIRSNVAALQRFRMDGVLSVTDRLLMIGVCGALLFLPATAHTFKIEWFVLAQISCYLVTLIIGFLLLRRIVHIPKVISFRLAPVWKIVRQSAPYALLTFLMAIYMRSDVFLLERLCKDKGLQAGIYASASRLLDVSNQFAIMFAAILLPLFGRMLAKKENVAPIIRLCANLLLPVSLLLSVCGWALGTDIMHLLYHRAGTYEGLVFAWLISCFPAYCIMYIYSTLLTANGHVGLLNKIAAIGVIVNLTLNFILIRQQQALGAAIATFITQWLLALCFIYFAARKNNLPTHPKWIGAHIGSFGATVLIAIVLRGWPIPWQEKLALLAGTGIVLMFVFRFISVGAIRQLLLNR